MNENTWPLVALCGGLLLFLLLVSVLTKNYSLNNIKNKTVGDGQHGTARWATPKEIQKTYRIVPYRPQQWRWGKELPTEQGIVLGSVGGGGKRVSAGQSKIRALVDSDDIHCLMIGAWRYRRMMLLSLILWGVGELLWQVNVSQIMIISSILAFASMWLFICQAVVYVVYKGYGALKQLPAKKLQRGDTT